MSTLVVSQFYKSILLLQCFCDITKWKKHFMVKKLKGSGAVLKKILDQLVKQGIV